MALPNIFSEEVTDSILKRIDQINSNTKPLWGKMTAAQMLAHCCVPYEYVYEPEKYKKPNFLIRLILKSFVKKGVTNEVPYQKNIKTGPDFIKTGSYDFSAEKSRLNSFLRKSQQDGVKFFDGRESFSFGKLNVTEWNNMFYKHLDHHLRQFGV
jgi:hypothetical protein